MGSSKKKWYSLADRRDMEEARELWEEIFPEDSENFLNYYDQWIARKNRMETRHSAGKLVSMVHWNPYVVRGGSRLWQSYYIVAVATRPEYRHRGLMAGQLRAGLNTFCEEKVPFLFLMPADPAIYTPFGFRYIYSRTEAEITAAEMYRPVNTGMPQETAGVDGIVEMEDAAENPAAETDAEGELDPDLLQIRALEPGELSGAAAFCEQQLEERYQLSTYRDREYMEQLQAECRSEGGELEGIFLEDRMIGILSWWGEDPVEIRELVTEPEWENGSRSRCLLTAIRRKWSWSQGIRMITTGWYGERKPTIMGRIASLPAFLRMFRSKTPVELVIQTEDPLVADNNGCRRWQLGPDYSRIEEAPEGTETDLRIDIADLMSWLSGAMQPGECRSLSMKEHGEEAVGQICPICGTFFNEIV